MVALPELVPAGAGWDIDASVTMPWFFPDRLCPSRKGFSTRWAIRSFGSQRFGCTDGRTSCRARDDGAASILRHGRPLHPDGRCPEPKACCIALWRRLFSDFM